MANGSSRKTPAPARATNGNGTHEDKAGDNLTSEKLFDEFEDDGSPAGKDDENTPHVKKAGGWDAAEAHHSAPTSTARSSPAPTGTAGSRNKLPLALNRAFPNSKPSGDRTEIQKCTHCKRGVSRHSMPKHVEMCLNRKQEKQRKKKEAKDARDAAARKEKNAANGVADSEEEEGEDGSRKTSSNKTGLGGASKKRKATEGDDTPDAGPAKKKSKKSGGAANADAAGANKSKAARPKAPVDVEKQCGVELPQGGQCARSLTCKSHSMGAKRAVPGRSAPYDKLLLDYQRKNQAKMQKAQFDANAPNPDDEGLRDEGPVDSDEEMEAVMGAIGRFFGGSPLYQHQAVPLRAKYQHNRIRGMMQSAFGRSGGGHLYSAGSSNANNNNGSGTGSSGGFFGPQNPASSAGTGPAPTPVADDNGIVHARRGSVVPGARSMMAPANRKATHSNHVANGSGSGAGNHASPTTQQPTTAVGA